VQAVTTKPRWGFAPWISTKELVMNVLFAHLPVAPLIYGIVLAAAGIMFIYRIRNGMILHAAISAVVLYVLFSMHGEQAETRMGAAIAALIIDIYISISLKK
jgi:hypothetical protein